MSSDKVLEVISSVTPESSRLSALRSAADPWVRYVIAMTPRSGSSHLCDVLKKGRFFGRPDEMLNVNLMPGFLSKILATSPDEYLTHVLRATQTSNGIAGIKCSWFQFRDFRGAMSDSAVLGKFYYIYLTRRDLTAQAISLYRATSSGVFHTNVEHSREQLSRLEALPYDYDKILYWKHHIENQEVGWRSFFDESGIFPLSITYEDIKGDVAGVARRIAAYIGRPMAARAVDPGLSVFRQLAGRQSVEWAARFNLEFDANSRRQGAA